MKSFIDFLTEKQITRTSDKPRLQYQSNTIKPKFPGYYSLGSGAFGAVYNKQRDDSVYKIYDSDSHDVSAEFHRHAMKESNPHLPKISKMVTVKHPNDKHTVISKMEKLHPLENLSHDELKGAWEHAFGDTAPKHITPSHISDHIDQHVKAHFGIGKIPGKATAHFTNAASDVAAIATHGNGSIDIKQDNIMARRNSDGSHHLVLNDPVWGGQKEPIQHHHNTLSHGDTHWS